MTSSHVFSLGIIKVYIYRLFHWIIYTLYCLSLSVNPSGWDSSGWEKTVTVYTQLSCFCQKAANQIYGLENNGNAWWSSKQHWRWKPYLNPWKSFRQLTRPSNPNHEIIFSFNKKVYIKYTLFLTFTKSSA